MLKWLISHAFVLVGWRDRNGLSAHKNQTDSSGLKLVLPRYTISHITIYNFTYHNISPVHHDIQCAHLINNQLALKAMIRKKFQKKTKKYSMLGSNR